MICAKHLFVFPSIAQECGLSHSLPELFPSSHCVVERFVLHRAGKVCVWGGHWSDFSLMSCAASCKSGKSCYSLHLLPEALERLGTRFPSLPICCFFCSFPSFALLALSILAEVRFRCSQFIAHSEREL